MKRSLRRRVIVVATILTAVSLSAGTVAHAYWTSTATGTGNANTGDSTQVTLTPAIADADLYPGAQTDVVFTATNPDTAPAHIDTLSLDTSQGTGGISVDSGHSGCSVAALSFTAQSNGGTGWTVPGRFGPFDGTLTIRLDNALSMDIAAANACQGATFTVYLKAS